VDTTFPRDWRKRKCVDHELPPPHWSGKRICGVLAEDAEEPRVLDSELKRVAVHVEDHRYFNCEMLRISARIRRR
jgi:hypothetical protein